MSLSKDANVFHNGDAVRHAHINSSDRMQNTVFLHSKGVMNGTSEAVLAKLNLNNRIRYE